MGTLAGLSAAATRHAWRYKRYYAAGAAWALMAAVLPVVHHGSHGAAAPAGTSGGIDVVTADTAPGGGAPGSLPASLSANPAVAHGGHGRPVTTSASSAVAALAGAGRTRGGVECKPGVKQLPDSEYSPPCVPAFTGANGGATWRGVTATKIRVVDRVLDDTQTKITNDFDRRAGLNDPDLDVKVRSVFLDYFNRTFELYGRQVELVPYNSQHGDALQEAQNKGREGACADATDITDGLKAFAVLVGSSAPFADCAAEHKLVVTDVVGAEPESFFADRHPYLWTGAQDCTRLVWQLSEYVGKRLVHRPARWAGDASYRTRTRKFGVYMPDNSVYAPCVELSAKLLEQAGAGQPVVYRYQVDATRLADQAQQAVIQFKGQGVTSVILADDSFSTTFLTQGAAAQGYRPEWILSGTPGVDFDGSGRQYDQSEVDGHMFGRSQDPRPWHYLGKDSEPGRLYKRLTGKDLPVSATGYYYDLVQAFTLLQSAGPNLTPASLGDGAFTVPDRTGVLGYWSFQQASSGAAGRDHSEIDDNGEVFWDGKATSPLDGQKGTFVPTYGEHRFKSGEWPAEEPRVYPGR